MEQRRAAWGTGRLAGAAFGALVLLAGALALLDAALTGGRSAAALLARGKVCKRFDSWGLLLATRPPAAAAASCRIARAHWRLEPPRPLVCRLPPACAQLQASLLVSTGSWQAPEEHQQAAPAAAGVSTAANPPVRGAPQRPQSCAIVNGVQFHLDVTAGLAWAFQVGGQTAHGASLRCAAAANMPPTLIW